MYNEYELVYQTPKEAFFNAVITNSIVLLGMQFSVRSMAYSDVTWQDCAYLPQSSQPLSKSGCLTKGSKVPFRPPCLRLSAVG